MRKTDVALLTGVCLVACIAALGWWLRWTQYGAPAASALGPSSTAENAAGGIVFANSEVDLGLTRAPAEQVFEFQNRGNKEVRILNVRQSCACTVTRPNKQVFGPGEKGAITVQVHPQGLRFGRETYAIDVEHQSEDVCTTRLLLHLSFWPDVVIPEKVEFRTTEATTVTKRIELIDYRDRPLSVSGTSTKGVGFSSKLVSKPTTYEPGWRYCIDLAWEGQSAPGLYKGELIVHTDDPERQSIVVGATLEVRDRIRVAPGTLRLTSAGHDSMRQQGTIYIDDRGGADVQIEDVTTSHNVLRCKFSPLAAVRQLVQIEMDKLPLAEDTPCLTVRLVLSKPIKKELCVTVVPTRRGSELSLD
jgi:hypothetical protein